MSREFLDRPRQGDGGPPEPRAERALAEADDVLTALRDELAGVSPSPEFASRVRERVAGELPLLREELAAVAPSPEFKARVRQQIEAAGPARGASWLSGWRWLVPATLAAAALLAVMLAPHGSEKPAPERAVADLRPAPIEDHTTLRAPAASETRTPSKTAASLLRRSKAKPADGPSMEVITNQPAILKALWERVAANVQMGETTTGLPETASEITVQPIEVSPVVVKLLVETPEGGASPIIRK